MVASVTITTWVLRSVYHSTLVTLSVSGEGNGLTWGPWLLSVRSSAKEKCNW